MNKTVKGPDGKFRCRWCEGVPEFLPYHDREWGFPVADDIRLFGIPVMVLVHGPLNAGVAVP